ncbi:hypothetical protein [Marinifilum caeruleilacunae]|uniref:DUF5104 domain-containing protein n=1 Tax=Marinifilum caeruleilacunae TaxID=2499076 RepID=A0ABX1X2K6_9BACT|nr:hypothetical protein [Marinifilum caeruleilacunae]NOU62318.1 hypothetical protein [Marinifilum caeruleilacunae]
MGKTREYIYVFIISLIVLLLFACTNTSSQTCHTAKELMEKSIEAINNKSSKAYVSLVDFDSVIGILENAAKKDLSYKEDVEMFKSNRNILIKGYSSSYNMLIGSLTRVYKLESWHFELEKYELESTEQEPGFTTENYIMKLKDENNNKWTMRIYIAKYNGCYYITEPIEANYLSKGW